MGAIALENQGRADGGLPSLNDRALYGERHEDVGIADYVVVKRFRALVWKVRVEVQLRIEMGESGRNK